MDAKNFILKWCSFFVCEKILLKRLKGKQNIQLIPQKKLINLLKNGLKSDTKWIKLYIINETR